MRIAPHKDVGLSDMEGEKWSPTKTHEDYLVSTLGRVKALQRWYYIQGQWGNTLKIQVKERILRQEVTKVGYCRVVLCADGVKKRTSVHRLVLETFVENVNSLDQINHKNGVKVDNRIENLEWCDQYYNQRHAVAMGLNVAAKGWDDNDPNKKPILMSINGVKIAAFGSLGDASRVMGLKRDTVRSSCNNNKPLKLGIYKGYQFNFIK